MAIGERIRFFRNLRGMTQKHLGKLLGFPERSADVRMAQYESGARTPKAELTEAIAQVLSVSSAALNVPDIDTGAGLMHTLFTLEDICGLSVDEAEGDVCLRVDQTKGERSEDLHQRLCAWREAKALLRDGKINQATYDHWRHFYPDDDLSRRWVSVPSEDFMDCVLDGMDDPGGGQ